MPRVVGLTFRACYPYFGRNVLSKGPKPLSHRAGRYSGYQVVKGFERASSDRWVQSFRPALGRGNPLAVKIRTAARRAARWLGDQLELWPLSFGRLLAWRILARLDEVGPRLQRLAASRDHLAVPV